MKKYSIMKKTLEEERKRILSMMKKINEQAFHDFDDEHENDFTNINNFNDEYEKDSFDISPEEEEESKEIFDILMKDPKKIMEVNLQKLLRTDVLELLMAHPQLDHNSWFHKWTKNAK